LTVGQLWAYLRELTSDLQPANVATFCVRVREIATGKRAVDPQADSFHVSSSVDLQSE
jgi:hypothetical protein